MHEIDLTRVDLNLLVAFEALLAENHVGRAADRLALSQSATSHALGRLRILFDDPLFVRHPRGMAPTPRGRALAAPVQAALAQLRALLQPAAAFDPARLRCTFTVAAHDYALAVLVPPLIAHLRAQAPGVDLRCVSMAPADVIGAFDRGALDLALGGFVGIAADRVTRTALFTDTFVGVARRGHPCLKSGKMTRADFLAQPHVLVSPDGQARDGLDAALGAARHVALTVPSFLALPATIGATDMVAVLPERLARQVAAPARLAVFAPPLALDVMTCSLLVPAALAGRPEISWMTDLLRQAATASRS